MGAFKELAALVEAATGIQPEGRRVALAVTLRQLDAWETRRDLNLGALGAAFERLSAPRGADDARVAARRRTCGELAELALATTERRDVFYAHSAWSDCAAGARAAAETAAADDAARLRAIAETMVREGRELGERVRLVGGGATTYAVVASDGAREGIAERGVAASLAEAEALRTLATVRVYTDHPRPSHSVHGRVVWGVQREFAFEAHPPPPVDDGGGPFGPMRAD